MVDSPKQPSEMSVDEILASIKRGVEENPKEQVLELTDLASDEPLELNSPINEKLTSPDKNINEILEPLLKEPVLQQRIQQDELNLQKETIEPSVEKPLTNESKYPAEDITSNISKTDELLKLIEENTENLKPSDELSSFPSEQKLSNVIKPNVKNNDSLAAISLKKLAENARKSLQKDSVNITKSTSIEDVLKEAIQLWLNKNLPSIVNEIIEKEIKLALSELNK